MKGRIGWGIAYALATGVLVVNQFLGASLWPSHKATVDLVLLFLFSVMVLASVLWSAKAAQAGNADKQR